MKIPLRFQTTEYDCAPTSFINALLYLYEREEIPAILLKTIYQYSLDEKRCQGTSRESAENLANILSEYAKDNSFKIRVVTLTKNEVQLSTMKECLNEGGVIIARCYQDSEHYVLITNIDDNSAYLFDPYYLDKKTYIEDDEVVIALKDTFTYNRIVKIDRLFSESKKDFSLMEKYKREILEKNLEINIVLRIQMEN